MSQTESNPAPNLKAFEQWFKGSKVTGLNGEPLVVFHGSSAIFDIAEIRILSHFGTCEAAHCRLREGGNHLLFPVYLNIRNPLEIMDMNIHSGLEFKKLFTKENYRGADNTANCKIMSPAEIRYCFGHRHTDRFGPEKPTIKEFFKRFSKASPPQIQMPSPISDGWEHRMIKTLQAKGYDGFTYSNQVEDRKSLSFIIFNAAQILPAISLKSAAQGHSYYAAKGKIKAWR